MRLTTETKYHQLFKNLLRRLLTLVYRIEIKGAQHLECFDGRVLVIANHTSFLDAALLWAFLPVPTTYAINTHQAAGPAGRFVSHFARLFPLDPGNPLSIRNLIKRLKEDGCVAVFPEGRITVTGALMKVYSGPGLIAEKGKATILPIRIDGGQYTPFSRLKGRVRLRWFPPITLNIMPPRCLFVETQHKNGQDNRDRRELAGKLLADMMTEMIFETGRTDITLSQALLDARKIHGGRHTIAEDSGRRPLNYNQLISRSLILGNKLEQRCRDHNKPVGLLLPNSLAALAAFWGLQLHGRVPAMLNYSTGSRALIAACETVQLQQLITSRRFIEQGKLEPLLDALHEHFSAPETKPLEIIYLEDIAEQVGRKDKLNGLLASHSDKHIEKLHHRAPDEPAVILFTSGTEGTPKGVALSHRNLLANIRQLTARTDFTAQDIALNALPMFHSFGLTAGTLFPITSGIRIFLYPSPLHYRVIPEIAYDINATLMFGTNTFLDGYGRAAHPYDFYSVRYVFAGAEKLKDEVRALWQEKFGLRIFEGYGATEAAPVISGNTAMDHKAGTVGRLMPGIEHRLSAVEGLSEGKRLHIRGPNIMLGYIHHRQPGVIEPPDSKAGRGWYDTGDIVTIDDEGYITLCGRAKRFAKIGGEMISMTICESLAEQLWPEARHAAVALSDPRKGEQLVLLTSEQSADRSTLLKQARIDGINELALPRNIIKLEELPLLGSGKIDYQACRQLAAELKTSAE